VPFEKLGAHVQAHVETSPIIAALRLCNRFGNGANSYIHKLPIELVERIEKFVVEPERERHLVHWSKLKKCWEGKCILKDDHPIPEQEPCPCFDCARVECKFKDHPLNLNGHVCLAEPSGCYLINWRFRPACIKRTESRKETWKEICKQNKQSYEDEFTDGYLNLQGTLLRKHFGIGIWVTQTAFNVDKWAVLAYLTLPYPSQRYERWEERLDSTLGSDSGIGIPLHIGAAPSAASLKRFDKALKRLGLKLFIHRSQKHAEALEVGEDEDEVSESEEEVSEGEEKTARSDKVPDAAGAWPQLTLLMQNRPG
jgi:hypothetical protein